MKDSSYSPGAPGWSIRKDMGHIPVTKKLKKENKELKDQLLALAERLDKLENKE